MTDSILSQFDEESGEWEIVTSDETLDALVDSLDSEDEDDDQ